MAAPSQPTVFWHGAGLQQPHPQADLTGLAVAPKIYKKSAYSPYTASASSYILNSNQAGGGSRSISASKRASARPAASTSACPLAAVAAAALPTAPAGL